MKWMVTDVGGECDGIEKNGIFIDPNLDSGSESTGEWEDESPYPEVRAAVSNTDDMEMPVDTIRAWMIGLFWAIIIPGLNQFLYFRYPSITIGSVRCTASVQSQVLM
ncbi:hypothetical protein EDB86DRAFT_2410159 [Lactarius hatsudake]|nr:hypothetical protein EDB86DRAFT_2410159 [Lactarius hatsudake]